MGQIGLFVVGIFLFGSVHSQPAAVDSLFPVSKRDVCNTKNCQETAADILSAMDRNTDPCTDFYQYACGKWIRNNQPQDGEDSKDRYEKLRSSNDEFVKNLMASSQSRNEYQSVKTVIKTFQYYDSCIDMKTINARGYQPMKTLLQKYNIWVDSQWDESVWHLEDVLIALLEDLGTKAFFEFNVELGMSNNSFYFISLKQPTKFSLPRVTFASKAAGEKQKLRKLHKFMYNLTQAIGIGDPNTIRQQLKHALRFERKLARSALPEDQIDYNTMTIAELIELDVKSTRIDWLYVFQQLLPNEQITNDTIIILNGKKYFKKLVKYVTAASKRTLATYMMWKVLYDFHLMLGQTFVDHHRYFKEAIGESWTPADREDTCMEQLSNLKGFALPLTRVFVDKKFKGGNKQWILNATDRIRSEFISSLKENLWMDDTTNKNAKKKAQFLKEVIGYPDFIMDDIALDQFFYEITISNSTYFENYLSLVKFWTRQKYYQTGKARDNEEWTMSPVDINAQYEDSYNRMVFPVAILQPPFYSGKYSSAVNFGGIGTVMGHELTHGFDDSGKNYDENGRRHDWWSPNTLNEFQTKSQCLIKQYSGYTFYGRNVDGSRSLSENIADNGGLKLALSAYRSWVKENGKESTLPGTNLTNEQIFFVSFAQNWCSAFSANGIDEEMKSNYSPTPIRVNGSLKNFKDFAQVFNCKAGTKMNPKNKCGLW